MRQRFRLQTSDTTHQPQPRRASTPIQEASQSYGSKAYAKQGGYNDRNHASAPVTRAHMRTCKHRPLDAAHVHAHAHVHKHTSDRRTPISREIVTHQSERQAKSGLRPHAKSAPTRGRSNTHMHMPKPMRVQVRRVVFQEPSHGGIGCRWNRSPFQVVKRQQPLFSVNKKVQ